MSSFISLFDKYRILDKNFEKYFLKPHLVQNAVYLSSLLPIIPRISPFSTPRQMYFSYHPGSRN